MGKSYRYISYLFVFVLALVFWGFYKTYFSLFPRFEGLPTLLHIHALLILLWFAMLIAQPLLILRYKNIALHRLVGKASYVLVPLMVICIGFVMHGEQTRGMKLDNLAFGFSDMSFFLPMYFLAIFYRHKAAYHARFMVLTVLPFINPALGRLPQFPVPGPAVGLLIIIGLLIFERFKTRIYKPYVIGLIIFLSVYIFFLSMINTPQWEQFWQLLFGK